MRLAKLLHNNDKKGLNKTALLVFLVFSFLLVLLMLIIGVFPVVYGILPSEFKIVFWQGIPTLLTFLMFATGATAIKIIINRKLNRKEEK